MLIQESQPQLVNRFLKILSQKKLAHAYLFEGKKGVGKQALMRWLTQTIFCQNLQSTGACDSCVSCQRIRQGDFSNVYTLMPEGQTIKVDLVRQLKHELHFSSLENDIKVIWIVDVDKMSISAANSLLKFLEEPQKNVFFFMSTTQKPRVLSTILSRSQVINVPAIPKEVFCDLLQQSGVLAQKSYLLAGLTNDVEIAKNMAQDEAFHQLYQAIWHWFELMAKKDVMAFVYVQTTLMALVTTREQAILGLDMLIIFCHDVICLMAKQDNALYIPTKKDVYKNLSVDSDVLMRIAKVKELLYANVSIQACYEQLSLLFW